MLRHTTLLLCGGILLGACSDANSIRSNGTATIEKPVFSARGQEPGWLLTPGTDQLVLLADYGQRRIALPLPPRQAIPNGYRYVIANDAHRLRIDVVDALCHDTMSGLPYPAMVTLDLDGRRLDGCGGAPETLLQGNAWVVERIGDAAVLDGARPIA